MMPGHYTIRVHWGYWMVYAQQPFHHVDYCWDGQVTVEEGRITRCSLLEFSGHFGPGRERLIPLAGTSWHWQAPCASNRFGGIVFEIEGGPESVVCLSTRTVDMRFEVGDLLEQKVIRRHVGPRYSNVDVTVMFDGDDPSLDRPEDLALLSEADGHWRHLLQASDFQGSMHRWYRTDWVWAAPGSGVEVRIEKPDWTSRPHSRRRVLRAVFRCVAAVPVEEGETFDQIIEHGGSLPVKTPKRPNKVNWLPYRVLLNGTEVSAGRQFFGFDWEVPLIEELSVDLPEDSLVEANTLRLQNDSEGEYLLVARLYLEEAEEGDFEVASCPKWVLLGEEFEIALRCRSAQHGVRVETPPGVTFRDVVPRDLGLGEHRFRVVVEDALTNVSVGFVSDTDRCETRIEQVVAATQEAFPMRVGIEDRIIPIDNPGFREEILRFLKESQLGDYMIFRKTLNQDQFVRWVELCRQYGIWYALSWTIKDEWARAAKVAGDPYCLGLQFCEHDGPIWGYMIRRELVQLSVPEEQRTMRTAYEDYLAYWKRLLVLCKDIDADLQGLGMISAIGHDIAYQAGMESCVTQLNKTHNSVLLADARGSARAHGRLVWGSYQAEGAHVHPEGDQHLRMWWLSLHLAYVCGAAYANDEETLLRTWHERLYTRGDRVPRMRQDIQRRFNRYIKTHPRQGQIRVKQAVLIGRYACDVVDGITSHEGIPPMVWRNFGSETAEWLPSTPEYGLRYLDVFFPGVWLHTLEQSPQQVRRWYSGTPSGEIELIPIDASEETLSEFGLLLLLGWNTIDEGQYEHLKKYVEGGGRLFMSVPHLTTNESRAFLLSGMAPLNLVNDGDFSDLFAARVTGRGPKLNSIQAEDGIEGNPVGGTAQSFRPSYSPAAIPKHPPVYLAKTELCGAEVLAREADSGEPLLIRHRLGKGEAYLLCTNEFPGSSWLSRFMTDLVRGLSEAVPWPVGLDDPSGDVYYTVREELETGLTRVHLLNTDWTEAGNERRCVLRLGDQECAVTVKEGRLSEVVWLDGLALCVEDEKVYAESVSVSGGIYVIKLHGFGRGELLVRVLGDKHLATTLFRGEPVETTTTREGWTAIAVDFEGRSTGECSITVR